MCFIYFIYIIRSLDFPIELTLKVKVSKLNTVLDVIAMFSFLISADLCRHLKFSTPIEGYALHDHVIKNISLSLGMQASCRGRCTIESKCVSINIGPPINDMVLCQLSDSDHIRHPEDLKPLEGFKYRGTEVGNSKSVNGMFQILTTRRVCLSKYIFQGIVCLSVCLSVSVYLFVCLFVC